MNRPEFRVVKILTSSASWRLDPTWLLKMTIEPFHIDPNHLDTGCSWEGQLDGGTDLDSQQSLLFRVCKRCYFDQESNLPPDILELWQFSQNFFHRRVSLSWIFSFFSSFDCLDLKTSYIGFGLRKLPTLRGNKALKLEVLRCSLDESFKGDLLGVRKG